MACKGPEEEVRPLNLACAYAPSPEARPTHFTMSRCLSIFNFCLHLPLELWHRKPQEDVVRREGKLTKCDQGLTSHEVPSAPSGARSSWKKLERFFSFSPVPFMEQKTHKVKVQPETTLPFRITALSEGKGPLESPYFRQGSLKRPPRGRCSARSIHNSQPSSVHPKASLGWPHTQATGEQVEAQRAAGRCKKPVVDGEPWPVSEFILWVQTTLLFPPYLLSRGLSGKSGVKSHLYHHSELWPWVSHSPLGVFKTSPVKQVHCSRFLFHVWVSSWWHQNLTVRGSETESSDNSPTFAPQGDLHPSPLYWPAHTILT